MTWRKEFTKAESYDRILSMDNTFHLEDRDRVILEEFHRACVDKRTADKIKAILLMNKGFSYQEIEAILLLDERTLNRYKNLYEQQGIDGLTKNSYQGASCKLTDEQIKSLKEELNQKIYPSAEAVCDYVRKNFKVQYTVRGMVQTLHRLGYSYKKATPVPGKYDAGKQEAFVRAYNRRYKSLSEDEKVYFMDGCHPTFSNHIGYGWIAKGKQFPIKTQDGRKRINLPGAYNPQDAEAVIREYETLNAITTIAFLKELRIKNGDKRLHIICDNVPYQHAGIVKEAARSLHIHLKYLPAYSPNLNLIERYWGFLKQKLLANTYFDSFEVFGDAILRFSRNRSLSLKNALRKYIQEKFHLFEPILT
jgi:transposase